MGARPVIGGNRLIKFIKRWKNWWCTVIALVFTLGFALSYTPGSFLALRSPTERETVLYYFAQNIGKPALCGQVSWAAHRSYSVLFGGGGASFWRSDGIVNLSRGGILLPSVARPFGAEKSLARL
jgi:hypothetical protein